MVSEEKLKKRAKIIVSITACFICLSLLVFGVYAATKVSFNFETSLEFEVKGVWVGVSGGIYEKSTAANAEWVQNTSKPSYILNERKNFDGAVPDTTEESYEKIEAWTPEIFYASAKKPYIQYRVTFKNYSQYQIKVSVENGTVLTEGLEMTDSGELLVDDNSSASYTLTFHLLQDDVEISQPINVVFKVEKAV